MAMQSCAAEDNLDMVSASVHVLALLGGGVCPVAGSYSFFYFKVQRSRSSVVEVAFPLWVWGRHILPPLPVCSTIAGGGLCACGYLYCGAHRVPHINTCGCME